VESIVRAGLDVPLAPANGTPALHRGCNFVALLAADIERVPVVHPANNVRDGQSFAPVGKPGERNRAEARLPVPNIVGPSSATKFEYASVIGTTSAYRSTPPPTIRRRRARTKRA
jgi:hypothetical protein